MQIKSVINFLLTVLFSKAIVLCLILSYFLINLETVVTLLVFCFLFLSISFYLNGSLTKKLGLLAFGSLIGVFCNLIFFSFEVVGVEYLGDWFNVLYVVSYPVLNLLWIVSFWCASLAILPKPGREKQGEKIQW